MSSGGMEYVQVQMADASTSTAEDRETDIAVRGMSESPMSNCNSSAFTFPKPNYGYTSYNQADDIALKNENCEYTSDPYNDLRDEVNMYSFFNHRKICGPYII